MQPFTHNDSISKNPTANIPFNLPYERNHILMKLKTIQYPPNATLLTNPTPVMNPRAYIFYLDRTIVQPIKHVLIDLWSRIAFHDAQTLRQQRQIRILRLYSYAVTDQREHQYAFFYPHYVKRNDIPDHAPPDNDDNQNQQSSSTSPFNPQTESSLQSSSAFTNTRPANQQSSQMQIDTDI